MIVIIPEVISFYILLQLPQFQHHISSRVPIRDYKPYKRNISFDLLPLTALSCTELKKRGLMNNAYVQIDPDGMNQGLDPFWVFCNMVDYDGVGVTEVGQCIFFKKCSISVLCNMQAIVFDTSIDL